MTHSFQRVLVTGANGFIGKNLVVCLGEIQGLTVTKFTREDDVSLLPSLIANTDVVIHLAGENRPADPNAFETVNVGLTKEICVALKNEITRTNRPIPLIVSSSAQADQDNPYGISKRKAEQAVETLATETGNPCYIYRLPGVFGKWCKPNYNSVVATFCHNIARGLPIKISDPATVIKLVYVDDVINSFLDALNSPSAGLHQPSVAPEYSISLGDLAEQIRAFESCRHNLVSERVGEGLVRALYATYLSYQPPERFSYEVPKHEDPRGVFVEMLKTKDSGQFSFFTAHPGVTRGGHYHHTKTEKFLVLKGEALFRFRHIITDEVVELKTSGTKPQIVDTIPGWSHDITNIGDDELIVMLWANEIFDRQKPDTIASKV